MSAKVNSTDDLMDKKSKTESSDLNLDESKDVIEFLKANILDKQSLSDISRFLGKVMPTVVERLVVEYETLAARQKEVEDRAEFLGSALEAEKDVFMQALQTDEVSAEKLSKLPAEMKSVVRDYLGLRKRINEIEEKTNNIKNNLHKIQDYIDEFGLKTKNKPDVGKEFDSLLDSVDRSMSRISENVRVNLYSQISSALSSGQSDTLPVDLLELINRLVIDRLENVLLPYEELSAKYVSGQLSHDQFTDLLRKNAFLSLLREKVIEDIVREYENNNITAPNIPMRLRLATERMVNDAKNLQKVMVDVSDSSRSNFFNSEDTEIK